MQKVKSFLYQFLLFVPLSICSIDQHGGQKSLRVPLNNIINQKVRNIPGYDGSIYYYHDMRTLGTIISVERYVESYMSDQNISFDYKNLTDAMRFIIKGRSANQKYIGSYTHKEDCERKRLIAIREQDAERVIEFDRKIKNNNKK